MDNKRNIAVDIGNTRIKSGLFFGNELLESKVWSDLNDLKDYCIITDHDKLGFISVAKHKDEILTKFDGLTSEIISIESNLPINLNYETPETLGIDRVASVIGGSTILPDKNLLVIDLGSCITYDLLDDQQVYQGGIISPGLKMRMRAMAQHTYQLPDISAEWENHVIGGIGKTTKSCMTMGSFNAIIHELTGFIEGFRAKYSDLAVILTGGDAIYFESKLKQPIFADLFLVLRGINRILNHE